MVLGLIVGCEIGFWVVLGLGLWLRYRLRSPALSRAVLLCIPLLDALLLGATAIDLHQGAVAEFAHGLAAVYLGFTLVYGAAVIKALDRRAAHKFADQPAPASTSPTYGWEHARDQWRQWFKAVAAGAIAAALLMAGVIWVDNPETTQPLLQWLGNIAWFLAIWLVGWPLWYSVFPKRAQDASP